MDKYTIVLDIGSQYVSAGLDKDDFFVKIPTVVAVDESTKQVLSVGVSALNNAKLNLPNVKLVYPVLEGAVIDVDGLRVVLEELFLRLLPHKTTNYSQIKFLCVVPCGMISSDKATIETLLLTMGAKSVNFVETPLADSLQIFKEFRTNVGFIVNVGCDCTDFAAVYGDNIVAGCTVYNSSRHLTEAIMDKIRNKYLVQLSYDEAEELKLNCASLYPNDASSCTVSGLNMQNGNSEVVNVTSKELYDTMVQFFKNYVNVINSLFSAVPEQILPLMKREGIFLCGGGAKLSGLDAFLYSETGMPVRVSTNCDDTSVMGGLLYEASHN